MSLRTINRTHKKAFKGKTVPLTDLCLAISDCPHYTPNWTESGELVIRNFNIKNGRLDLTERYYTDKETFLDRIKRHKPESGDLIITREAPMGEVCIIPEGVDCCLGQRMVLIKPNPKKVNNRYLLYAMLSEFVQKQIKKSDSSGSIVSNLCIPDLEQLNIPYIPLTEQEKVASILNPIFESIEVNDRINSELENLAKTIYNYWFVQFDFPYDFEKNEPCTHTPEDKKQNKCHCKPYKTSGGEMEWNEELKREIPKGWEVNLISKYFNYLEGPGITKEKYTDNGHKFINIKCIVDDDLDITEASMIKYDFIEQYSHFLLEEYDIVVSTSGTLGRSAIVRKSHLPLLLNTSVIRFRSKNKEHFCFMYSYLKSERFLKTLRKEATGSIQKNFGPTHLDEMKDAFPSHNLIKQFEEKISPIIKQSLLLKEQNTELIKLRDFLLPLLMNGQVKVKSDQAQDEISMAAEPQPKYGK